MNPTHWKQNSYQLHTNFILHHCHDGLTSFILDTRISFTVQHGAEDPSAVDGAPTCWLARAPDVCMWKGRSSLHDDLPKDRKPEASNMIIVNMSKTE